MTEILALLQVINQSVLDTTTRKRMVIVILAMLAMTGRITMRDISRWTEEGGSYRTIQRFFNTKINRSELMVAFVTIWFADPEDIFLLAGDETVVTKAGKETHGLDRFFSSIFGKPVKGALRVTNVGVGLRLIQMFMLRRKFAKFSLVVSRLYANYLPT